MYRPSPPRQHASVSCVPEDRLLCNSRLRLSGSPLFSPRVPPSRLWDRQTRGRVEKTNWPFRCRGSLTSSRAKETNLSSLARPSTLLIAPLTATCVAILIVSRVRIPCNHVRRSTDASPFTGSLNQPPGTRVPFFPWTTVYGDFEISAGPRLFRGGRLLGEYEYHFFFGACI